MNLNTMVLFVSFLVVLSGCSAIMPMTPAGGANKNTVNTLPAGPQIVEALFNASVPERNTDIRTYTATYDAVWGATLEAMKSLGNPIIQVNKQNGIIATDYQERRGFPAVKPWRDKYYTTVSAREDGTLQVGIKRTVEEQEQLQRKRGSAKVGIVWREAAGLEWTKKASNGSYESYLLTLIENQLASTQKSSKSAVTSPSGPPPAPQVPPVSPPPPEPSVVQPPAQAAPIQPMPSPGSAQTVPPPDASSRFVYVTGGSVNLRAGPGTKFKPTGTVPRGTKLMVLEASKKWLRIRHPDGREGWIAEQFTKPEP